MASDKPDILLIGPPKPVLAKGLDPAFTVHRLADAQDRDAFIAAISDRVRGFAVTYSNQKVDGDFMRRFPSSKSWRASGSAMTMSTPDGPPRTASSSPTRRAC